MHRPLLFVSLFAALSACDTTKPDNGDPTLDPSASLSRFSSCDQVDDYLVEVWLEQAVQARYGWGRWALEDSADAEAGSDDGPSDYSTTNVQEGGVDEPDMLKTDGKFIYVAQDWRGQVDIVKSWPADASAKVGSVDVDGYPYAMFLRDDKLLVYSYVHDNTSVDTPFRWGYGTRMSVIDVTDRTAPTIEREIDVDAWLASSRMIGGDTYSVFNAYVETPQEVWELSWDESLGLPTLEWDAPEAEKQAARELARGLLRPMIEAIARSKEPLDYLPKIWDHAPGETVDGELLVGCSDLYRPDGIAQPGLLAVSHLDLDADAGAVTNTGLLANGWQVYASEDALYVSQSSWWWWWGWGDLDLQTHIHKFALAGEDTVYEGSGSVDGWLHNQFSLSEKDGYLRVATTRMDWWWGTGTSEDEGNDVHVLEQQGDKLVDVGDLTGLAPGEMIMSARFVDDKLYLVTFEQVDPLFVIDMSDPKAPALLGELKVTGFSSYMHPVGDDHLLTVGMEATEEGAWLGMAVSLFDVSDPTNPVLQDRLLVESDDWSWSEALWDHHAFTFHNGTLALPLYTWDYDEASGDWDGFSGLWTISVDTEKGLATTGRVDHEDLVAASECLWADAGYDCGADNWYAGMRRSVIMEDKLYSVSNYGMKVSELADPDVEVASVLFWPR